MWVSGSQVQEIGQLLVLDGFALHALVVNATFGNCFLLGLI